MIDMSLYRFIMKNITEVVVTGCGYTSFKSSVEQRPLQFGEHT